jgi:energy-converting hydrogenase Eha subunit E
MTNPSRKINRQKVFTGVILICAGVLIMLMGQESGSPLVKTLWMGLLGVGVFFYLWGRFFSRDDA